MSLAPRTIVFLPAERAALQRFMEAHQGCDGALELRAFSTAIGDKVEALCRGCGEVEDLSDGDAW